MGGLFVVFVLFFRGFFLFYSFFIFIYSNCKKVIITILGKIHIRELHIIVVMVIIHFLIIGYFWYAQKYILTVYYV